MGKYLRALSPSVEFVIVIAGAFGLSIWVSVEVAFSPGEVVGSTENDLWWFVGSEIIIMALLGWFLAIRGWNLRRLGFNPDALSTAVGIVLAVATRIAAFAVFIFVAVLGLDGYEVPAQIADDAKLSMAVILAVCTINSVFEEIFVTAYIITVLRERGAGWLAIHVSVAVRLLYHLYLGGASVTFIIPMGLIFAYWYMRTGNVWPLIVGHAVLNIWALSPHAA